MGKANRPPTVRVVGDQDEVLLHLPREQEGAVEGVAALYVAASEAAKELITVEDSHLPVDPWLAPLVHTS